MSASEADPPAQPILLIDADHERAALLQASLRCGGYAEVVICDDAHNLIDLVSSLRPAMVLIDVESPSRDTLEQLTLMRDHAPRPVVLFSQDRDVDTIEAAITSGVSAYVTDGIDPAHVLPAIGIARATFQNLQSLRTQLDSTRADLAERKIIERAKGVIMRDRGWDEERAYLYLRRTATNQRRRLVDLAQLVIDQGAV